VTNGAIEILYFDIAEGARPLMEFLCFEIAPKRFAARRDVLGEREATDRLAWTGRS
jgi:hypothetical protein